MPTTICLGRPQAFCQRPHHGVEGIGDADDKGAGRIFPDAGADLFHHLEVDAEQIVAAHSRLARDAGGDDADAGAVDGIIGIGAGILGIKSLDRRRLDEDPVPCPGECPWRVEQYNITELWEADEMSEGAADLPSTDPMRSWNAPCGEGPRMTGAQVINPFGPAVQDAKPANPGGCPA